MTKMSQRQLELPVLVDVNVKLSGRSSGVRSAGIISQPETIETGFHKLASDDDQSIYKAISDNYFRASAKQA